MLHSDAAGALAGLQRAVQSIEQGLGRVAAPSLPGGGNFSSLFQQVNQEVSAFIQNGATDIGGVPGLSPEGWMHQRQVQAVTATEEANFNANLDANRQSFVNTVAPLAERTATQLGVAPELLVAHAALESGWGQRPLRQADGRDTHNLFSIKAGGNWRGDSAQALTTEYEQGQATLQNERFRSYPDYASAFQDYAQLLRTPRYQGAVGVGDDARAFAQGLVRGGYATDPAYADKLVRVAASVKANALGALQSRSGRD